MWKERKCAPKEAGIGPLKKIDDKNVDCMLGIWNQHMRIHCAMAVLPAI